MSKQQLENYKKQLSSMKEEICFLERIGDAETLQEYERESYGIEQKILALSRKLYGDDVKVDNVMAFDYVDTKNDWNSKHFTVENPDEFDQTLNDNMSSDRKEHEIKDLKSLRGKIDSASSLESTSDVLKLQNKLERLKLKLNESIDDDDDDSYEELFMVIKATKKKLKVALANQNAAKNTRNDKASDLIARIKKLQSEYASITNTSEIEQKFAEFDMSSSANVGVDVRRQLYNSSYQMDTKLGTTDSNGNPLVKVRNHGTYSPPGGSGDFDYVLKSRIR